MSTWATCGKTAIRPERQNTLTRPSGHHLQLQPATTFLFSRTDRACFLHEGITGHRNELWASSRRLSMIDLPPTASTAQPTEVSPQRPLPMHPGQPLPATHRRRMDHSSNSTSILTLYVCTHIINNVCVANEPSTLSSRTATSMSNR